MADSVICRDPGSNWGPPDLQSDALPSELSRHMGDVVGVGSWGFYTSRVSHLQRAPRNMASENDGGGPAGPPRAATSCAPKTLTRERPRAAASQPYRPRPRFVRFRTTAHPPRIVALEMQARSSRCSSGPRTTLTYHCVQHADRHPRDIRRETRGRTRGASRRVSWSL